MPLHLITGPAGSGKTRRLMNHAAGLVLKRKSVTWVGLPHQRERTLARLTLAGTLLGLNYFTLQQLYYRLLEHHPNVRPLAGPGLQLAHVAQAIREARGRTPTPGEATLYHHAIKEAKRAALTSSDLPGSSNVEQDLRDVYDAYGTVNGVTWDYEDYRQHALTQLQANPPSLGTLIVDGFIDIHPTDLHVIQELARHTTVHLALEHAPDGLKPDTLDRLDAPASDGPRVHALANPVQETRWVLRSLKRDLAEGTPMHELMIVTPERHKSAFLALASEYGVPISNASPATLAESQAGRLLAHLLRFAIDADRGPLHAIPDLQPIAQELTRRNLHGREATQRIASELGLDATLSAWSARLTPPQTSDDVPAWITSMLELLTTLDPGIARDAAAWERVRESLALRGSEAAVITVGPALAVWWSHLLNLYPDPSDRPRGIPLANPLEATGLRVKKAYLTRTNVSEYQSDQGEDYFIPEDERSDPTALSTARALPKRITGRTRTLLAHLQARGDTVTVTYPEANQDGPLAAEPALTGGEGCAAPILPAASTRETRGGGSAYQPTYAPIVDDRAVRVRDLKTFLTCPFKARFEPLLDDEDPEPWRQVLYVLVQHTTLTPEMLATLAQQHPTFRPWLERHESTLQALTLNHRFDITDGAYARAHAMRRDQSDPERLHLYWFGNPETTDQEALLKRTKASWERKSAIHHVLGTLPIRRVVIHAWPIGFDPVQVLEATNDEALAKAEGLMLAKKLSLPNIKGTLERYKTGEVTPSGGWHCKSCRLRDVSRVT